MIKLKDVDFYFVTDSKLSRKGIFSDVKDVLTAGCKIVQYREKNKNLKDMIKEAENIKKMCDGRAIFLVNDNVDIALAVNADGIHIGKEDISLENARKLLGKDKTIGVSVDNVKEAVEAERLGADYIGLGPIFVTTTKKDVGEPCGVEMIKKVRRRVRLPIIAIGGITKDNVADVIKGGADAAVAVSAVVSSKDVSKEVCDFIRIIQENKLK